MPGEKKQMPAYMKFIIGGLSGMGGTLVIQPLDLLKNRMQLSGVGTLKKEHKSSFDALQNIIKNEGVLGLYAGLSAALLRQAVYTSVRLGAYSYLFGEFSGPDGSPPGFVTKVLIGLFSGMTGAFVGTPCDVALVRMTADGKLPASEKRNYKNVFNALSRIAREEGIKTLWKGAFPTMGRAMVVNTVQLTTYSQTKQFLLEKKIMTEGLACHFMSSLTAGLFTTIFSLPVDVCKTRIQNMKTTGKPEYTGMIDAMIKISKNEGLLSLWKGFTPYFARVAPHSVIALLLYEQLTIAYYKYVLGQESGKGAL